MHRQIDTASGQRFLNLLGENSLAKSALGADLAQGNIGDLVAGGVNDFDFDVVTPGAQQRRDVTRLPEGQLRAAGADAKGRHHLGDPSSFSDACNADPLSRRLKSRRTTSITVVASASRAAVFSVVIGVCMTLLMMPRVRVSTAISCSGDSGPSRP